MRARTVREVHRHLLVYAGLAPFVVIAVFPVYWMAVTAFKQDADLYRMDGVPFWFHLPPTLEHFARLFSSTYFTAQLVNTLQLAVWVVLLTMVMAVPAGYALARLRLPGAVEQFVDFRGELSRIPGIESARDRCGPNVVHALM